MYVFSSHLILLKLTLISSVDSDVHIYFPYIFSMMIRRTKHILMNMKIQASSDNYRKIRRKRK